MDKLLWMLSSPLLVSTAQRKRTCPQFMKLGRQPLRNWQGANVGLVISMQALYDPNCSGNTVLWTRPFRYQWRGVRHVDHLLNHYWCRFSDSHFNCDSHCDLLSSPKIRQAFSRCERGYYRDVRADCSRPQRPYPITNPLAVPLHWHMVCLPPTLQHKNTLMLLLWTRTTVFANLAVNDAPPAKPLNTPVVSLAIHPVTTAFPLGWIERETDNTFISGIRKLAKVYGCDPHSNFLCRWFKNVMICCVNIPRAIASGITYRYLLLQMCWINRETVVFISKFVIMNILDSLSSCLYR